VRRLATAERIRAFLDGLGRRAAAPATLYLTGGATAVLMGWRDSTIDIDIKLVPDRDELLRLLPGLKEELEVNVEFASPDLFIPVREGWEDRSPWVATVGSVVARHFDLYAQALAKIERGHSRDLSDVDEMLRRGLVAPSRLMAYFEAVEPYLFRYPAVDPVSLRTHVEDRVTKA
jgi:hypothetical protein